MSKCTCLTRQAERLAIGRSRRQHAFWGTRRKHGSEVPSQVCEVLEPRPRLEAVLVQRLLQLMLRRPVRMQEVVCSPQACKVCPVLTRSCCEGVLAGR